MSVLKGVLQAINNPYATIAKDGLICGDISGYVDSGIYLLNGLLSGKLLNGGFPYGKVTALAGEKGTGKTFLLLLGLKNYLDQNPKAEIIFFESEGALTQDILLERGIDDTRVSIIPISTVEELRNQALVALEYLEGVWLKTGKYPEVVMCLDSLGMLGTEHEVDTIRTNKNKADMGKRAQLVKSIFRTITLKLSLLQIPMIITAHTYKGMGKYDPTKLSGGQGVELAASIIIFLSKSGIKIEGKGSFKELIGNNINFIVHKGRMTIEGSRAKIPLDFKEGISRYGGLMPLLVDAGIFNKAGAWYSYGDERIGQGEKKAYAALDNFMTDDILSKLQPLIEDKFCYGVVKEEIPKKPKGPKNEKIKEGIIK